MHKVKLTILFIIISFSNNLFSQINISGQIKNQYNKSIEFLEIQLQNKDSIIVKSELTNNDGKFIISTEKGEYLLLIKQFGKILQKQKIIVEQVINLNVIIIKEIKEQLQEVIISSKKRLIERKVDRLIFNVENSISASGGDAFDALKITPSLNVQNDKITMVGKNDMRVMVDDKLIQLSGDDLINFLKTIPSDNIKSIEVITTPPAKYSAEGNSGLVNIKLKKAKKDTLSGFLNSAYTQSKYAIGNIGAGLNYQKKELTLISNIAYSNGSEAPIHSDAILYPKYKWDSQYNNRNLQNYLSGGIALDYKISPKTIIGIDYSGSKNILLEKSLIKSSITNFNTNQLDSLINTKSDIKTNSRTQSINFHYITKLDTVGKKISVDTDYFDFNSEKNNEFNSNTFFSDGATVPNTYNQINNLNNQVIKIYSSKIDVEMPLNWINLTFGTKISFINNSSENNYFDTSKIIPIFNPNRSNVYNYKENTQAIYISGSKNFNKKWDLQLGLRVENTQTTSFSLTLNQTNKNKYIKFFPTFYLTFNANENSSFSFNYSRRIDRPSYNYLNPFRNYITLFNYYEGNPFLQPYFSDNIEFSNTYKNLYTSLSFNHLNDGIDYITFVTENSNVQLARPLNSYTKNSIVLTENYSFTKWKWLESNNAISGYFTKIKSNIINVIPELSRWSTSINSNNSFILNKVKTIKASLDLAYTSSTLSGNNKISGFYSVDVGAKYSLLNKNLKLSIVVFDLFKTNKYTFFGFVNGIRQEGFDYLDPQKVRFSLTYNFGKSLKVEQREQNNEVEKGRVN